MTSRNVRAMVGVPLVFFTLLLGAVLPAQAAFVTDEQGVIFTINVTDAGAGIFTLNIAGLLDATGDWANVTQVGALAFKDLGTNFTVTGSTLTPGTTSPNPEELNANGCAGGSSTGQICFDFNPLFAASNDMTFTIDLNGSITVGPNGPHLKVNFMDESGTQIGSLLSENLPGTNGSVPEPGALAVLGTGLTLVGWAARRRLR